MKQYLQSIDAALAELPIIIKAFASGEGLAHLLSKAAIIRQDAFHYVSRFTWGFSQADDMFDFVLVGKGKDRVDHKLMGEPHWDDSVCFSEPGLTRVLGAFRQFAENPSCRRILLGGCHDNGYVRMLEKYVHIPAVSEKVTLLKSFQTGKEFDKLPFVSTTMDSVFRKCPLGEGPSRTALPDGSVANVSDGTAPTRETLPPTASATPVQANGGSTTTYAARAATPFTVRPLPLFGSLGQGVVIVNAESYRLDCPLPPKSRVASDSIHQKTVVGRKRYCNMYHLSGNCDGKCGYLHEALTSDEKLVLRHRLRGEKCKELGRCRNPRCFYGHHCSCSSPRKCIFPSNAHNVDVSTWRELIVPS